MSVCVCVYICVCVCFMYIYYKGWQPGYILIELHNYNPLPVSVNVGIYLEEYELLSYRNWN